MDGQEPAKHARSRCRCLAFDQEHPDPFCRGALICHTDLPAQSIDLVRLDDGCREVGLSLLHFGEVIRSATLMLGSPTSPSGTPTPEGW
jgi:hypothetical protein